MLGQDKAKPRDAKPKGVLDLGYVEKRRCLRDHVANRGSAEGRRVSGRMRHVVKISADTGPSRPARMAR
jgi:hypothetical protein